MALYQQCGYWSCSCADMGVFFFVLFRVTGHLCGLKPVTADPRWYLWKAMGGWSPHRSICQPVHSCPLSFTLHFAISPQTYLFPLLLLSALSLCLIWIHLTFSNPPLHLQIAVIPLYLLPSLMSLVPVSFPIFLPHGDSPWGTFFPSQFKSVFITPCHFCLPFSLACSTKTARFPLSRHPLSLEGSSLFLCINSQSSLPSDKRICLIYYPILSSL